MRSLLRVFVIAGVVAATLTLMLSTTVLAASYKPDARIRFVKWVYPQCGKEIVNGPWIGDDVYSANGTGEKYSDKQYNGGDCFTNWYFDLSIQNAGTHSDTFKLKATGAEVPDSWKVTYKNGTTNVTSKVKDGTFKTGSIAPGHDQIIKIVLNYLGGGDDLSRTLTVTSMGGGQKDAVKIYIDNFPDL